MHTTLAKERLGLGTVELTEDSNPASRNHILTSDAIPVERLPEKQRSIR
jgi:hypothetical protein